MKAFQFNFQYSNFYIFGQLKNPLVYKNIVIPMIGPIPNIKRTNFAEFFV